MSRLSELLERQAALQTEISELTRDDVVSEIADWMRAHPLVDVVQWSHWTPSWNDGDACRFGVSGPFVGIKPYEEDDSYYWEEESEYLFSEPAHPARYSYSRTHPALRMSEQEIKELMLTTSGLGGAILKVAFGPNAKVSIKKDGGIFVCEVSESEEY